MTVSAKQLLEQRREAEALDSTVSERWGLVVAKRAELDRLQNEYEYAREVASEAWSEYKRLEELAWRSE